jgi:CheY-like chemotaxis protein
MKKVLVVEDNETMRSVLSKRLNLAHFSVTCLKSGMELLSHLTKKAEKPDAVVLDLMLPGRSGFELLSTIKSMFPTTKIFIFSGFSEYDRRIPEGLTEGFFAKTEGVDRLINQLSRQLAA